MRLKKVVIPFLTAVTFNVDYFCSDNFSTGKDGIEYRIILSMNLI